MNHSDRLRDASEIKVGETLYKLCMGTITEITVLSEPYEGYANSLKFDYEYVSSLFGDKRKGSSYLSDYNVHNKPESYNLFLNAVFSSEEKAIEYSTSLAYKLAKDEMDELNKQYLSLYDF